MYRRTFTDGAYVMGPHHISVLIKDATRSGYEVEKWNIDCDGYVRWTENYPDGARTLDEELAEIEQERIYEALDASGYNLTKAAKALGLASYQTLVNRCKKHGIQVKLKGGAK